MIFESMTSGYVACERNCGVWKPWCYLEYIGHVRNFTSSCHDACTKFLSTLQCCLGIFSVLRIINEIFFFCSCLFFLVFCFDSTASEKISDHGFLWKSEIFSLKKISQYFWDTLHIMMHIGSTYCVAFILKLGL